LSRSSAKDEGSHAAIVSSSKQPNVAIIHAKLQDLPEIARLAKVIWRMHYPGIISPAQIEYMLARSYAIPTMREEMTFGGIRYDCLVCNGEIVGFSSFGPATTPGEFKLHKLYVHPAHQRRGFGSLLLECVCREMVNAGGRTLVLAVNKANEKAIAAYQKNGFSIREPVIVDIGAGFVMDDYVLEKRLAQDFRKE
jgi:ribosomal protein S18 acetylase RimI-like enzyme